MSAQGFVLPALAIGLGSISLSPKRGFFPSTGGKPLIAQATLEETHHDDVEISDHPVEQGAAITDHAYKRPAEVIIRCGFSNSPTPKGGIGSQAVGLAGAIGGSVVRTAIGTVLTAQSLLGGNAPKQVKDLYADFVAAQNNRVLFDITTGKRKYKNMLIKSLAVTTDVATENALIITVTCREILIVKTSIVTVPINAAAQKSPEKTSPTVDNGQQSLKPATNFIQGAP